jgi:hypothetical protein
MGEIIAKTVVKNKDNLNFPSGIIVQDQQALPYEVAMLNLLLNGVYYRFKNSSIFMF